jgi:hypothetical protein
VRKEPAPLIGAQRRGNEGDDGVFLVVEVRINELRETFDEGHHLFSKRGVGRSSPPDRGLSNPLTCNVDRAVCVLHAAHPFGSVRDLGGQLRPDHRVLGRVMKVDRRHHEVDVVCDDGGAVAITVSDASDEARGVVQLSAETAVDQCHFERITRHFDSPRSSNRSMGAVYSRRASIQQVA